eukprot:TRINITY_DN23468_c0_g1_i1.p1 TRINITY_DN23468_c0_g1~~TRINITY_DN23468_c0_g1_i1.p1  ORF type:complete len:900 (+),score=411.71 TRINITY_DN23468_c0_g1_i1:93-2792(+)
MADGLVNPAALGHGLGDVAGGAASGRGASFVSSSDIDEAFRIKIDHLEGTPVAGGSSDDDTLDDEDLYAVVELWSGGEKLCASAHTSRCRALPTSSGKRRWQQWLLFPVKFCDLPIDTVLCCTVWSSAADEPFGGTSTYVFSTRGQLKRSSRRLLLHRGKVADGHEPSTTFGRIAEKSFAVRTEKRVVQYNLNELGRVDWLDRVTSAEISLLRSQSAVSQSDAFLLVDFPVFPTPVFNLSLSQPVPPNYQPVPNGGLVTMRDPDIDLADSNPCEVKAVKIMKSQHLAVDPDLKPNAAQYTKIQGILRYTPLKNPSPEDGTLLWHFRYFLSRNKLGFTKFMRCVDWADPKEERMAKQLIPGWGGLTLEDCLEVLGSTFKGITAVRNHAVARLDEESVETLQGLLLQLVQALRYEKDPLSSNLLDLLLSRAAKNWGLCSYLYWYAAVETHEANELSAIFKKVTVKLKNHIPPLFRARLTKQVELMKCLGALQTETNACSSSRTKKKERAAQIVREGGCGLRELFANSVDPSHAHEGRGGLLSFGKSVAASAKTSMANLAHYHGGVGNASMSAPPPAAVPTSHSDPVPDAECDETLANPKVTAPLFPDIGLVNILPDKIYLFKSAKMPMSLSFTRADGKGVLKLMYKSGDDIRQDQLVLQIITIIDKLLLQDGLDLKLTPYRVLATSVSEGFIELVEDVTQLQDILENIHGHLQKYQYDANGDFLLKKDCLDNWVKSNAGYAIITFILGIGDRHLENLLVTNDGRILHIDFGFILGRDPKPFPPPLKLRKDMVDAMGGLESVRYNEFKKLCCSAFNIVRKHSALLLDSLAMMTEANIPDLTADVRTTKDVCAKIRAVEAKLRLDLNDAEATNYFLDILNEAINSFLGKLSDVIHKRVVQLRD